MPETAPDVTIIGAGMSGMTAALKLVQAGFSVRVIEASGGVGGKFGARPIGRNYEDFAWHVFAEWCRNFWDITQTIGLSKTDDFAERPSLTLLRPLTGSSRWPRAATVSYVGSPEFFWANVNSGVAHWSDKLLFTYSLYALLCDQSVENEEFLNRVSVNGYMRSLPYRSDVAALLHNELLLRIWAIPSYLISARAYQTYLQLIAPFTYPWSPVVVLKKNFEEGFWKPFRDTLGRFPHFSLETGTRLTGIRLDPASSRVSEIVVQRGNEAGPRVETVRQLIVTIPPDQLSTVLTSADSLALRQALPDLLDVAKLPLQQTSTLTLAFKRQVDLPGVGGEPVALVDHFEDMYDPSGRSQRNGLAGTYGLSFLDIGRLRNPDGPPVLSVLASDAEALKNLDDAEALRMVIKALQEHLMFNDDDIDWDNTSFQGHRDEALFVNAVGTWEYRPEARLTNSTGQTLGGQVWRTIPNLFVAGDYCRSQIDIVSLEGATHTGIWAAHVLSGKEVGAGRSGRRIVDPPRPPKDWDRDQALLVKTQLERWAELAQRRSRTVADQLQREQSARSRRARTTATHQTPHQATSSEGATMTKALSTFPGFSYPLPANPTSANDTEWLAKYVDAAPPISLSSGTVVPLPLLFWEARALVLHGVADAEAVDALVLADRGLRAFQATPGKAAIDIWVPDYGGVGVGPIKSVFAAIVMRPGPTCSASNAALPHLCWWWYYGNSVVNQAFKRETWGVENQLAVVETAYRGDTKSVRLLENGRMALRLKLGARDYWKWMIMKKDPEDVPYDAIDRRLSEISRAITKETKGATGAPEAPFTFVSVANRKTDDGENEVELLGAKIKGSRADTTIPYDEDRDEFSCGVGTTVEKSLKDVGFKPIAWDFYTTYNGVVKIYDGKGRATPPERREADPAQAVVKAITAALKSADKK